MRNSRGWCWGRAWSKGTIPERLVTDHQECYHDVVGCPAAARGHDEATPPGGHDFPDVLNPPRCGDVHWCVLFRCKEETEGGKYSTPLKYFHPKNSNRQKNTLSAPFVTLWGGDLPCVKTWPSRSWALGGSRDAHTAYWAFPIKQDWALWRPCIAENQFVAINFYR